MYLIYIVKSVVKSSHGATKLVVDYQRMDSRATRTDIKVSQAGRVLGRVGSTDYCESEFID